MKIVAVIPARAGSRGVPNKNIRILNGKPLIWYSMMNALKSKNISEVIVSTDSDEIATIAKQMGIRVHKRDARLCGDDITLDAVIYDAVKNKEYDYIITMQPTSPTLKVETLDSAISYAIDNDLDTVISVINQPHLSWKEVDGKKVPNYEKRLNRQYLPANYMETGAFVISKSSVVTESTRIGSNIDVFEISEGEAIDIDTFQDLRCAELALQNKRVAFYVNGNNLRGTGHVYRALELADEFYLKPDIYYDINQTDPNIFGRTTHNIIGVNGIGELLSIVEEKKYDIFINDILSTTIDYMIALKQANPNIKLINFEDCGEGIYKADLVFNALFQERELDYIKVGEKYYISPKLFMFYEPIAIKERVKKIFISFGGADPQNYSDRLLEIIRKEKYSEYEFVVVLGRAKKNIEELLKYNEYKNIEVYYDIANMPEVMSQCDMGITSRGRTGYELAFLGIPSIAMAQNKREEQHGFVCNENGFSYLGLNPSDYVIESTLDMYIKMNKDERQRYQNILLTHDLKNGRKRVMNLINNL